MPNLTNQLLDLLEDILIENRAYKGALRALDAHLPPQSRQLADRMIAAAKADPKLRAIAREGFSQFRDQSPEQVIEGLLKHLSKDKDVN